jgi:hypothetical protein
MTGAERRALAERLIGEDNPEALFADGFDEAIIGVAAQFHNPPLVVYDLDVVRRVLMAEGISAEQAEEYISFNITGAWAGPGTPLFLSSLTHQVEPDVDGETSEAWCAVCGDHVDLVSEETWKHGSELAAAAEREYAPL